MPPVDSKQTLKRTPILWRHPRTRLVPLGAKHPHSHSRSRSSALLNSQAPCMMYAQERCMQWLQWTTCLRMDLPQGDSSHRSVSAGVRSTGGHFTARLQRHAQHSSKHSRTAFTSPVPVHLYPSSSLFSTDLTGVAPKSFTAPVSAAEELLGSSGGVAALYTTSLASEQGFSTVHGRMATQDALCSAQNAATSDAAPVYVPPNDLCPSGPCMLRL